MDIELLGIFIVCGFCVCLRCADVRADAQSDTFGGEKLRASVRSIYQSITML